MFKSEVISIDY